VEPCDACGATVAADAQWCGQCYAVAGRAPLSAGPLNPTTRTSLTGATTQPRLPPTIVKSRWRKTQTTFGPVGRVLATIGLVIPLIFFAVLAYYSRGLIIGGLIVWGVFLMPLGLRDIWKAGKVAVS
jgi:hypothetical protein